VGGTGGGDFVADEFGELDGVHADCGGSALDKELDVSMDQMGYTDVGMTYPFTVGLFGGRVLVSLVVEEALHCKLNCIFDRRKAHRTHHGGGAEWHTQTGSSLQSTLLTPTLLLGILR